MVPLDVTHKVPLLRERAQQELGNSRGRIPRFILDATQKYRDFYRDDQEHDGCYLHDPLAVGVAIDLSFVRKEERRVYVETEGKETRGMTLPFQHPTIKKAPSNVSVCVEVESERFLRFFLQRLKG
jgi:inosine-uridine nucleoside N-ribohydrolase